MIGPTMTISVLDQWNQLDVPDAAKEILPCCGSSRWARAVAERRPLLDREELLRASQAAFADLTDIDWTEVFESHPRIGEQHANIETTGRSLGWSRAEQVAADSENQSIARLLREGNQAYEARFGHIFLVCAAGRSRAEILAHLHARLHNDPETEQTVARREQEQITALRLERWLVGA